MKAISLMQPMAWAIFHGKDVENRTWKTNYRGRILIHASKNFDQDHFEWICDNLIELDLPLQPPLTLAKGVLLGMVDIVDCVTEHSSPWFFGPYGFVLKDAALFGMPIPYKGELKIFDVPDEVIFRRSDNGKTP